VVQNSTLSQIAHCPECVPNSTLSRAHCPECAPNIPIDKYQVPPEKPPQHLQENMDHRLVTAKPGLQLFCRDCPVDIPEGPECEHVMVRDTTGEPWLINFSATHPALFTSGLRLLCQDAPVGNDGPWLHEKRALELLGLVIIERPTASWLFEKVS
jgi:hypothetical protein